MMVYQKNTTAPVVDLDYPNIQGSPERALLYAIIENAARDAYGRKITALPLSDLQLRRTHIWLNLRGTEDEPFTYSWICDQLNICPEKTLKALKIRFSKGLSMNIRKRLHN